MNKFFLFSLFVILPLIIACNSSNDSTIQSDSKKDNSEEPLLNSEKQENKIPESLYGKWYNYIGMEGDCSTGMEVVKQNDTLVKCKFFEDCFGDVTYSDEQIIPFSDNGFTLAKIVSQKEVYTKPIYGRIEIQGSILIGRQDGNDVSFVKEGSKEYEKKEKTSSNEFNESINKKK